MVPDWYWIVGWVFAFFGLVGNTWVIFIIAKRRRLHTTANWLILSLAVADLGVTCGYFPASMVCNVVVNSCKNVVRLNLANFFIESSIWSLIAMVAERYIAIVYSLKYVRVFTTNRRAVVIIAASWGIPAIMCVFRLLYNLFSSKLSTLEDQIISLIYTLFFNITPIITLIAATLHILLIARRRSLQTKALLIQVRFNIAENTAGAIKVNIPKMGLRASTVRVVICLVIIFVACYGIEIHARICHVFVVCVVSEGQGVAFNLLLLANSVLNPLVYALLKEDIKRETIALFCRSRRLKTPRRLFQVHPE